MATFTRQEIALIATNEMRAIIEKQIAAITGQLSLFGPELRQISLTWITAYLTAESHLTLTPDEAARLTLRIEHALEQAQIQDTESDARP